MIEFTIISLNSRNPKENQALYRTMMEMGNKGKSYRLVSDCFGVERLLGKEKTIEAMQAEIKLATEIFNQMYEKMA